MTTKTTDSAAQAAINAAARELHLPTVRAEAERLAEIAALERHTHRGYLAEVLAAEVDDRTERPPAPTDQRSQVPQDQETGRVQHRRRRVVHTAPPGAITAAKEMGVQFRSDCGIWKWPGIIRQLRTVGDLAPNTCKRCRRVILAQR